MILIINSKNFQSLKIGFIATLLLLLSVQVTANALPKVLINVDDWLSYDVVSASETINDFYGNFPPGTYFGNWSVISGDKINYNISSVQEAEINGTLFFGNLDVNYTFTDVRNIDVAFGLGLGIYPWSGGFLADASNWDNIISSIDGTNTTVNQILGLNFTINKLQKQYSILHFNTSNFYGQYSSFYYHRDSGVLLNAFVSFGSYELNISLNSTSLELEPYKEPATTDTAHMGLVMFISSIFLISTVSIFRRKTR